MSKWSFCHKIWLSLFACALLLLTISCGWNSKEVRYVDGKTPIVEINAEVLYLEDIKKMLPLGLSDADSAKFTEQYIRNWAQDILFYQNAIKNIPDTKDVDELVENYRRALFEHEYQRRLIYQKFSSEISDEEIERFYNDNSRLFELNESLVKGLFLKISNKSHDLNDIMELYTNMDDESFEEIEKYSIRNAARCDFFYDHWRTVSEIEVLLPLMDETLEDLLKSGQSFEFKDEEYIYLLNVSEFVLKGDIEPLDYARNKIRELLINSNEVAYIQKIKSDLYDAAIERERIVYHQINK